VQAATSLIRATLVAALVAGVAGCHAHPQGADAVEAAHPDRNQAPELGVVDLAGKPVTLAALRGKVVLLDFWATWCEPCQEEMPRLAALQQKDGPRGLQIVGLSMDDQASTVRSFLQTHPLPYPVAMASTGLAERYGRILGLPTVFLVDRRGHLARKYVGEVPASVLGPEVDRLLKE
jgi:cytochrome c biogenesis protein CcmG/thiol:disulfide interchange protein DsbE